LKGAAGSLGAITIAEAAADAEQSLKVSGDLEISLRTLEDSLAAVVASIRSKLPG
jgi:HPt (histidine-containing phosphotransfer) domain-containing protein